MSKLCKNQLIEKLVPLFRNTDTDIDEAVAKAKKRADNETKSQSFDAQVKRLLDKGYAEVAGMEKDKFLKHLNVLKENFRAGSVIVIPENMVSLDKMMTMVEVDGKTGYAHLDTTEVYNAEGTETPRKPYLIYDAEDGKAMLNTSPDNCVKKFKKQGRFGQNAQEGIAMVTYKPEILKDHYVDLTGSRFKSSDNVPNLYLYAGRPKLDWNFAGSSYSKWGSASCGSR